MTYNIGFEIKPKLIYQNRKSYHEYVSNFSNFINVIDFDKQRYYGFRNKDGLEIYPNIDKMVSSDDFDIVTFDFVAEAYKELVDAFYNITKSNTITSKSEINGTLSKPAISLTGIDYDQVLEKNYLDYNSRIVSNKDTNLSTTDLKSYTQEYIKNISRLKKNQSYLRIFNNHLKRNITGIAINLLDKSLSNDQDKIKFLEDNNFFVLRKLCEQYGFYININIPWQLVANLSHPNMIEKASKLNDNKISNINDIINHYYNILLFDDYENQKEFFYDAYSDFYNKREYYTDSYYCDRKQETITKDIFRKAPPDKEAYLKSDELQFLKIYLDILNAESKFRYSITERNKIFKDVGYIYFKTLDKNKALVYIRSRFYDTNNEKLHSNNKQ